MNLSVLINGGFLIAIVFVLFLAMMRLRANTRTPPEPHFAGSVFHDDPQYWHAGIFYNNPDDPELFIPRPMPLGLNLLFVVNWGHP